MSEIIVGADIVPTPSNQAIFESGNMDIVVDEKYKIFYQMWTIEYSI